MEQPRGAPRGSRVSEITKRTILMLKTYTQLDATEEGHPLRWTSENIERARELANELTRPWGASAPTPAETWDSRTTIDQAERDRFPESITAHRVTAAAELGLDPQTRLARDDQARRAQVAVPQTLIELQYLERREGRRAKLRTAQSAGTAPPSRRDATPLLLHARAANP